MRKNAGRRNARTNIRTRAKTRTRIKAHACAQARFRRRLRQTTCLQGRTEPDIPFHTTVSSLTVPPPRTRNEPGFYG
ncbi:hypothetical protein XELAEV_18033304mg [Xenopus laevis]|uniref:Uncharacterized protein n=1 Tax=Xenopus laevis TaxID=8355 RepID=A0A974CLE2_XENLA|nr:hypothetical protein XELAEV_18033304mg [Xenopus laevis]